jgi:hypothetical protein
MVHALYLVWQTKTWISSLALMLHFQAIDRTACLIHDKIMLVISGRRSKFCFEW